MEYLSISGGGYRFIFINFYFYSNFKIKIIIKIILVYVGWGRRGATAMRRSERDNFGFDFHSEECSIFIYMLW